jgi:hypothetical protein
MLSNGRHEFAATSATSRFPQEVHHLLADWRWMQWKVATSFGSTGSAPARRAMGAPQAEISVRCDEVHRRSVPCRAAAWRKCEKSLPRGESTAVRRLGVPREREFYGTGYTARGASTLVWVSPARIAVPGWFAFRAVWRDYRRIGVSDASGRRAGKLYSCVLSTRDGAHHGQSQTKLG